MMCNLLFRTMLLPGEKNCVNAMPMFKMTPRELNPWNCEPVCKPGVQRRKTDEDSNNR